MTTADARAGRPSSRVTLPYGGRDVAIEYAWIGRDDPRAPQLVFLHEGLGSLAMWKDYPQALCAAAGVRGLVFSRPGYGRSTPRARGCSVTATAAQSRSCMPRAIPTASRG
jgi:pimeloyl-ACP methyl ester carboxylesterase